MGFKKSSHLVTFNFRMFLNSVSYQINLPNCTCIFACQSQFVSSFWRPIVRGVMHFQKSDNGPFWHKMCLRRVLGLKDHFLGSKSSFWGFCNSLFHPVHPGSGYLIPLHAISMMQFAILPCALYVLYSYCKQLLPVIMINLHKWGPSHTKSLSSCTIVHTNISLTYLHRWIFLMEQWAGVFLSNQMDQHS